MKVNNNNTSELRAEVKKRTLSVMDAFCSASGKCRTQLTNEILGDWAEKKLHEATIVCRVAGVNPMRSDEVGK